MKNTDTKEKVLEILFNFPSREFHLRELSRLIKISPPSVSNAIATLQKESLLSIEKNVLFKIKAKPENNKFKQLKRVSNLSQIYESGIFDYLVDLYPLSTIILFGSYSNGEDSEKSDIDIAIIDSKEKELDMKKFETKLNRRVNIEFINMKNISKELKNSLINGINLNGQMEI